MEEKSNNSERNELTILNEILKSLGSLNDDARRRILETASLYYNVNLQSREWQVQHYLPKSITKQDSNDTVSFIENREMTPKQFLMEKKPLTDVERVACLAYYLTYYRNEPFFKTIDISKLNTEAAQRKFANPAYAVDNATKQGYLVPATNGRKQISAEGEIYVQKLPNFEEAKSVMANMRKRKQNKTKVKKSEKK